MSLFLIEETIIHELSPIYEKQNKELLTGYYFGDMFTLHIYAEPLNEKENDSNFYLN
jgi:hypothetical protein